MAWLAPGQRRSAPEGDARPRTTELADRVREISENGCRGQPWPDWKRRRHDGRSAGPGGYCAWRSGGADQPAPRAKQQSKSDRPDFFRGLSASDQGKGTCDLGRCSHPPQPAVSGDGTIVALTGQAAVAPALVLRSFSV
jgi:hypothetical protein